MKPESHNLVNWDEDYQKILGVLEKIFIDMKSFTIDKCRTLYYLARKAEGGCIVELGSHHGRGTITLCLGTAYGNNLEVNAVDWYKDTVGWAGEKYSRSDLSVFWDNITASGVSDCVTLYQGSFEDVVGYWSKPIALLVWDAGISSSKESVFSWEKHVVPGGTVALCDTLSNTLDCESVMRELLQSGAYESITYPEPDRFVGGYLVVYKKRNVP